MIYKIVVTSKKDRDMLKKHAYYFSERTNVMCFDMEPSHEMYHVVAKYFADEVERNSDESKNSPSSYLVTYNNGVFIQSEDRELASFFGSWVKDGYIKISVSDWWRVFLLLKHGVLTPENSFKERFPAASHATNINEMKTWNMKVQYRGPGWNFRDKAKKCLNFDGEKGIQIGSAKFLKESLVDRSYSVVTGFVVDISDDKKQILFKDMNGEVYNLQIKGWPYRFSTSVWKKDTKISFYFNGKGTEVYNPTIIPQILGIKPEEINEFLNEFGYISVRTIPVELLNRLKAEVMIRLWMNNEKL